MVVNHTQTSAMIKRHVYFAAIAALLLFIGIGMGQTQDSFQRHTDKVKAVLPKHSALPPLVDLSKPDNSNTEASRAWENRFTGSMGVREHTDPGVQYPSDTGSVSTTTTEYAGPANALPVDPPHIVVVARVVNANSHMAYNRRFVYSTFSLEISRVLKGQTKSKIQQNQRIIAAQLGGTVRYPSGHVETFVLAGDGFLDIGKSYFLFIWKPIRSDKTYMIEQAYLIQDDCIFSVDAQHGSEFDGMSVKEFESKIEHALTRLHTIK